MTKSFEIPVDADQAEALERVLINNLDERTTIQGEIAQKTARLEELEFQYDAVQRLHNDWLNRL